VLLLIFKLFKNKKFGGGIGRRKVMAWEYGDRSVESRHSEGRGEIQPKPCKVQILTRIVLT